MRRPSAPPHGPRPTTTTTTSPPPPRAPGARPSLREYRDHAERQYILDTLREVDWNISRAATLLGLERTNLHKKIRALGVKRD